MKHREKYKIIVTDKDPDDPEYKRSIKTYNTLAKAKNALKTRKFDIAGNETLRIGVFRYTDFGSTYLVHIID